MLGDRGMKDHHYYDGEGNRIPVSQLDEKIIRESLQEGIKIVRGSEATIDGVRERLLIELLIREKGLRKGL